MTPGHGPTCTLLVLSLSISRDGLLAATLLVRLLAPLSLQFIVNSLASLVNNTSVLGFNYIVCFNKSDNRVYIECFNKSDYAECIVDSTRWSLH